MSPQGPEVRQLGNTAPLNSNRARLDAYTTWLSTPGTSFPPFTQKGGDHGNKILNDTINMRDRYLSLAPYKDSVSCAQSYAQSLGLVTGGEWWHFPHD